jgi:hypothetical protein
MSNPSVGVQAPRLHGVAAAAGGLRPGRARGRGGPIYIIYIYNIILFILYIHQQFKHSNLLGHMKDVIHMYVCIYICLYICAGDFTKSGAEE